MSERSTITVRVRYVRDTINDLLANSGKDCPQERRQGMMLVLEDILHITGNYKGFRYLAADEVPPGTTPGINWGFDNDYEARFAHTDRTRVKYL